MRPQPSNLPSERLVFPGLKRPLRDEEESLITEELLMRLRHIAQIMTYDRYNAIQATLRDRLHLKPARFDGYTYYALKHGCGCRYACAGPLIAEYASPLQLSLPSEDEIRCHATADVLPTSLIHGLHLEHDFQYFNTCCSRTPCTLCNSADSWASKRRSAFYHSTLAQQYDSIYRRPHVRRYELSTCKMCGASTHIPGNSIMHYGLNIEIPPHHRSRRPHSHEKPLPGSEGLHHGLHLDAEFAYQRVEDKLVCDECQSKLDTWASHVENCFQCKSIFTALGQERRQNQEKGIARERKATNGEM